MASKAEYEDLKEKVFQESTAKHAFIMGVAHGHGTLPADLLKKWRHFLEEQLPYVKYGNLLTPDDCSEIKVLLMEMELFVLDEGPSENVIKKANEATPFHTWKSPMKLDDWRWR